MSQHYLNKAGYMTVIRCLDTMLSDFFAGPSRGIIAYTRFVAKSALSSKSGESFNTLPTGTATYYGSFAYGKYYHTIPFLSLIHI